MGQSLVTRHRYHRAKRERRGHETLRIERHRGYERRGDSKQSRAAYHGEAPGGVPQAREGVYGCHLGSRVLFHHRDEHQEDEKAFPLSSIFQFFYYRFPFSDL